MPPAAQWKPIFVDPIDSPSFEGSPCSCCRSMPAADSVVVDFAAVVVVFAVAVADFSHSHYSRYRCLMMSKMKTWHSGSAARGHWGRPLCTHKGHRWSRSHRYDSSPPAGRSTWSTRRERWHG